MKQVEIQKTGNDICLVYGKHKNRDILQSIDGFCDTLCLQKKVLANGRFNEVAVSSINYSKINHNRIFLFNNNGNFAEVEITEDNKLDDESFACTKHLIDILNLNTNEKVSFCRCISRNYTSIKTQSAEKIVEDIVIMSTKDKNNYLSNFVNDFEFVVLRNTFSGENLIVKVNHVMFDDTLAPGTIQINRKQRILLGLDTPLFLTEKQWSVLTDDTVDAKDSETIKSFYLGNDHKLSKNTDYVDKQNILNIIRKYTKTSLVIYPVLESYKSNHRKSLGKILLDFYVGKSTISLACRRPYVNDEVSDIVRMTKSNMQILGIEEMDKVVITYKTKRIKCRVLEIDREESFLENNVPCDMDLAIGIPAHLRKKLGIAYVDTLVKIDRDTGYIMKKSLNEQIIPVLLTIFSAQIFVDKSVWLSILLSIVAIPIVVYFNLSSKRNSRV